MPGVQDSTPDFAILIMGVARTVSDRLGMAVSGAGISDMRTPFGYVIRVLGERDCTLSELAHLLDVTKQAAIKVVDEMERRGFIERVMSQEDGRSKILKLTEKAEQVRHVALASSQTMEQELRDRLGDDAVEIMRRVLLEFLAANGGGESDARQGRSRANW
jgi:DNA-binding MarR family transcriptional regulator